MALFEHHPHLHKPQNVNHLHAAEQTGFNQRVAVMITKGFGSMQAFYILVAWMLLWMALASFGIWRFKSDPYPFTFLLFLSNLVQLWALPVLSVGQNVLSRKAELQAEESFNTTNKTFEDILQIMHHLEAQDEELLKQTKMLIDLIQRSNRRKYS